MDRESVKEAMGFVLDNADGYDEVGPSPPAGREHAVVPIFILFVMELVLACCRWLEY